MKILSAGPLQRPIEFVVKRKYPHLCKFVHSYWTRNAGKIRDVVLTLAGKEITQSLLRETGCQSSASITTTDTQIGLRLKEIQPANFILGRVTDMLFLFLPSLH